MMGYRSVKAGVTDARLGGASGGPARPRACDSLLGLVEGLSRPAAG